MHPVSREQINGDGEICIARIESQLSWLNLPRFTKVNNRQRLLRHELVGDP